MTRRSFVEIVVDTVPPAIVGAMVAELRAVALETNVEVDRWLHNRTARELELALERRVTGIAFAHVRSLDRLCFAVQGLAMIRRTNPGERDLRLRWLRLMQPPPHSPPRLPFDASSSAEPASRELPSAGARARTTRTSTRPRTEGATAAVDTIRRAARSRAARASASSSGPSRRRRAARSSATM